VPPSGDTESVYQEIEADRLLRREPLLVLDYLGIVEPLLGVAVRFFEAPLFEELDEVSRSGATTISRSVEKRALDAETAYPPQGRTRAPLA